MSGPSFHDWVTAFRHRPPGNRIPWLERQPLENLTAIPGSVLVLHLPSADGSGPGHFIVSPDGDSAFVTRNGTCWEFGPLRSAIDSIHEGSDGTVQVYMSRPASIHVTFDAEHGEQILSLARPDSGGYVVECLQRSGEGMGLFGRKGTPSANPPVSFPAGQAPPPGTPLDQYLIQRALAVTPNSAIPREDVMAYADASYANVLGIPDSDQIIAWGPGLIETPEDARGRNGTVVVTRNTMLAYWQPGRTSLIHTFQGNHSAVTAVQRTGDYSFMAQWEVAEYANNKGKFIVGSAPVVLSAGFGRDGHDNRRALSWFYTLIYLLGRSGASEPPLPGSPPSSGLGSSGTKL